MPHPAMGHARRVSVKDRSEQHKELLEAVQNHTPSVSINSTAMDTPSSKHAARSPLCDLWHSASTRQCKGPVQENADWLIPRQTGLGSIFS